MRWGLLRAYIYHDKRLFYYLPIIYSHIIKAYHFILLPYNVSDLQIRNHPNISASSQVPPIQQF